MDVTGCPSSSGERPAAHAQSSFILSASSTAISGSFRFVLIPVLSIGITILPQVSVFQLLSVAEYSSCAGLSGPVPWKNRLRRRSSEFLRLLSGNAITKCDRFSNMITL